MPTIPPGRYTRQKIRNLALNRAGNRALDADAVGWLAQILFDLYTLWDWPFLFTSATLQITGASFALPTDFYQAQDDAALRPVSWDGLTISGLDTILELDRAAFERLHDSSATGRPIAWTADRGAGVGLVTPNPVGHQLVATLRYKQIPPEPAEADEPDDVPVFPWSSYLVEAVYCEALQHERDPRLADAVQLREQMFQRIRRGSSPRHAQSATIPLDPTVFRTPFQGD